MKKYFVEWFKGMGTMLVSLPIILLTALLVGMIVATVVKVFMYGFNLVY